MDKPTISNVLRGLMDKHGIETPYELAKLSGANQPTVLRLLRGDSRDPRNETLKPFAELFNVSYAQLRGDEPMGGDKPPLRVPVLGSIETGRVLGSPAQYVDWPPRNTECYALLVDSSENLLRAAAGWAVVFDPKRPPSINLPAGLTLGGKFSICIIRSISGDFVTVEHNDSQTKLLPIKDIESLHPAVFVAFQAAIISN